MVKDFNDSGVVAVFKHIMIIDNLFKANGHIYNACLAQFEDDNCKVNGFDIMIDTGDERDDCFSFRIDTDKFGFVVDQQWIFFQYGSLSIQLELHDDESHDKDIDLAEFKNMILLLINFKSKNSFHTLDQFIDDYNCQYMTHT